MSYDVQDITQSIEYNKLPLGVGDVTLTLNTDGVPFFESSKVSMWPIFLMVNELPYKERIQKLLLAGLWVGPKKPVMNSFLLPLVKMLNSLSTNGLTWHDDKGNMHTTKAYPGPFEVDTIARCEIMNTRQFNGANGCAWCEDTGVVVPKGNGFCRVYPQSASEGKLRTPESFTMHASKARAMEAPSCGIKGPSVLSLLAFFTFASSFVVDYMHAVCLGFGRMTMFMWLNSSRCKQFQFRRHLAHADSCLLGLTPVWEMSRLPRSLYDLKDWKAADWRSWILFYSPIVLKDRIPQREYSHWLKFVGMIHYLLGPSVCIQQVVKLKKEMAKFLLEYEELYGIEHMSYNSAPSDTPRGKCCELGSPLGVFPFSI